MDLQFSRHSEECNLRILELLRERRVFGLYGEDQVEDGAGAFEGGSGELGEF